MAYYMPISGIWHFFKRTYKANRMQNHTRQKMKRLPSTQMDQKDKSKIKILVNAEGVVHNG